MKGLYPIVDVDSIKAFKLDAVEFARRVLTARPMALQLRAKHLSARETLELLRELRPLCTDAGTALFANDRPDLALLAGCDGVHVGQDDLSISNVRSVAAALRVGASTHDISQLERALSQRPDYVAFGPVFDTRSKERPDPVVGLELVREARRLTAKPIVAIGGIDASNAREVLAAGADAAVVLGAICGGDVAARARALVEAVS